MATNVTVRVRLMNVFTNEGTVDPTYFRIVKPGGGYWDMGPYIDSALQGAAKPIWDWIHCAILIIINGYAIFQIFMLLTAAMIDLSKVKGVSPPGGLAGLALYVLIFVVLGFVMKFILDHIVDILVFVLPSLPDCCGLEIPPWWAVLSHIVNAVIPVREIISVGIAVMILKTNARTIIVGINWARSLLPT